MSKDNELNNSDIKFLSDITLVESGKFGAKTTGVVKAIQNNGVVPFGFSISSDLVKKIVDSDNIEQYVDVLDKYVEQLLEVSSDGLLIVRSSSSYEDDREGIFSGLFDSYRNIKSTKEVICSIIKIVKNSKSQTLESYFRRYGLDISQKHMGVIVQSQIDIEIGGVVQFGSKKTFVEYAGGDLEKVLAGSVSSNSFVIDSNYKKNDLNITSQDFKNYADIIYFELLDNTKFYQYSSSNNLVVEFAFAKGQFYILQTKKSPENILSDSLPKENNNSRMANKTFAMEFFVENGLFSKPCSIMRAGSKLSEVRLALENILDGYNTVTIRFSKGNSIGLPRAFVKKVDEGLDFIQAYGKQSYDIIIHEYMDVIRSFEILVSQDQIIIEHVPGMWESENTLNPDVIILSKNFNKAYRYKHDRKVVLDEKTELVDGLGSPISDQFIEQICKIGNTIRSVMFSKLKNALPLNIHFVWDVKSNNFQCLNIRQGFSFDTKLEEFGELHYVKSMIDLDDWDGKKLVRLALITKRGREHDLIKVANRLKKSTKPVIIDFGLLSHPAMVLREYGCKLLPSYLIPQCFESDEYEQINL